MDWLLIGGIVTIVGGGMSLYGAWVDKKESDIQMLALKELADRNARLAEDNKKVGDENKRLLEENIELGKKIDSNVTGGDNFCYLTVEFHNTTKASLILHNPGTSPFVWYTIPVCGSGQSRFSKI